MKTIKIAGVPEHFNLPWHLCLENKVRIVMSRDGSSIILLSASGDLKTMIRKSL